MCRSSKSIVCVLCGPLNFHSSALSLRVPCLKLALSPAAQMDEATAEVLFEQSPESVSVPFKKSSNVFMKHTALGYGGTGIVCKYTRRCVSTDPSVPHTMAIKFDGPNNIAREARIYGQLTHPNIGSAYHFHIGADDAELSYICLELGEGGSLAHACCAGGEQRAVSIGTALGVGHQILLGLQYTHGKGIIHGDVKLANILLASSGDVMLSDFGTARPADPCEESPAGPAPGYGTPLYMSSDHIRAALSGHPTYDARAADMWSWAVCMYELLTGTVPFPLPADADLLDTDALLRLMLEIIGGVSKDELHRDLTAPRRRSESLCAGAALSRESTATPPELASLVMTILAPGPAGAPTADAMLMSRLWQAVLYYHLFRYTIPPEHGRRPSVATRGLADCTAKSRAASTAAVDLLVPPREAALKLQLAQFAPKTRPSGPAADRTKQFMFEATQGRRAHARWVALSSKSSASRADDASKEACARALRGRASRAVSAAPLSRPYSSVRAPVAGPRRGVGGRVGGGGGMLRIGPGGHAPPEQATAAQAVASACIGVDGGESAAVGSPTTALLQQEMRALSVPPEWSPRPTAVASLCDPAPLPARSRAGGVPAQTAAAATLRILRTALFLDKMSAPAGIASPAVKSSSDTRPADSSSRQSAAASQSGAAVSALIPSAVATFSMPVYAWPPAVVDPRSVGAFTVRWLEWPLLGVASHRSPTFCHAVTPGAAIRTSQRTAPFWLPATRIGATRRFCCQ